jgi:hypothetical protein
VTCQESSLSHKKRKNNNKKITKKKKTTKTKRFGKKIKPQRGPTVPKSLEFAMLIGLLLKLLHLT